MCLILNVYCNQSHEKNKHEDRLVKERNRNKNRTRKTNEKKNTKKERIKCRYEQANIPSRDRNRKILQCALLSLWEFTVEYFSHVFIFKGNS